MSIIDGNDLVDFALDADDCSIQCVKEGKNENGEQLYYTILSFNGRSYRTIELMTEYELADEIIKLKDIL